MCFNEKFSEFAEIGDLSKFTLDELKHKVRGFNFEVQEEDDILIAKWYNKHSELIILYNKNELFIKIFSDKWLNPRFSNC